MPKQAHIKGVSVHQSVLLQEVVEHLSIQKGDTVVDGTVGGGGHTNAFAQAVGASGTIIGFDVDSAALERAQKRLEGFRGALHLVHANFRTVGTVLSHFKALKPNAVLFDLGFSSDQLTAGRGLSFLRDEPLTMALADTPTAYTARDIVNTWEEESIADILFGWGQERYARRIARAIVATRKDAPIERTGQLVACIEDAVPTAYKRGKRHPATKTFQALRIAVNDEIGAITQALADIVPHMAPGGRVAVISFHSIEDRVVKHQFRTWKQEGVGAPLTKKPLTPSVEEIRENPRARSAVLRVFRFAD